MRAYRGRGRQLCATLMVTGLLTAGQLAAWSSAPQPGPSDARQVAADRLSAESGDGLRLTRGIDGTVSFAGVAAGEEIRNPAVRASTPVRAAARAHLERYGAAFGATGPGNTFRVLGTTRTPSAHDVVRFQQSLGGVPVIGGAVVVTMRPDRQPSSVLATLTDAAPLPAATITRHSAARIARRAAALSVRAKHLSVRAQGRWAWDPRALGASSPHRARGVWRFTVGDGATVREVLIDDRSGDVLLDADAHQQATNRVVCDHANRPDRDAVCTSGFARTEGSGPSGIDEVDATFALMGATATFYRDVGGVDLTQLLGAGRRESRKLTAVVRTCLGVKECPFEGAFWDGYAASFGDGFGSADDVVAHEFTHGVVQATSNLLGWGASGAINESLADVMGEILDHGNTLAPEDAAWPLGEDTPPGVRRSMSNPPAKQHPDRVTSPLWIVDGVNPIGDDVSHTDNGVGNKAAYLISQGGSFNGQTITGIDLGDPTLAKTARLYYETIVRLTSGGDYAELADVLEQSCQDLVDGALHGFTAADCVGVHQAVTATEMRATPSAGVQVTGRLGKVVLTWRAPSTNADTVTGYRVSGAGTRLTVGADVRRAVVTGLQQGRRYAFTVSPMRAGELVGPPTKVVAQGTRATLEVERSEGATRLSGRLTAGSTGLSRTRVHLLTRKNGSWVVMAKVTTAKGGTYAVRLPGTTSRTFRVRFPGARWLVGCESPQRRL